MKEKYTVDIEVDSESKEFSYHNAGGYLRTYPGDSITWTCNIEPFTIHFGWDSPFAEVSFNSQQPTAIVPPDAKGGYYRYSVSVYISDKQEILVDDPELIIRRKPREESGDRDDI